MNIKYGIENKLTAEVFGTSSKKSLYKELNRLIYNNSELTIRIRYNQTLCDNNFKVLLVVSED